MTIFECTNFRKFKWEYIVTHEGVNHMNLNIQRNDQNIDLFLVKPLKINEEAFQIYSTIHKDIISKKVKKEKKIIFGYDLREAQEFSDFVAKIGALHESLDEEYKKSVICVFLIVKNSIMTEFVNNLLTSVFKPVVPVKICESEEEINSFLKKTIHA